MFFIIAYICKDYTKTCMEMINNISKRAGNRIREQFPEGFNHR